MENLGLIFDALSVWVGQYLEVVTSKWLLQILLFLMILDTIVSIIILLRGTNGK